MLSESTRQRFSALDRLYGAGSLARLRAAHVCVVGIGGVGSWTVEALARSGVGSLTLIDLDEVCITNVNRQLHALDGQIGRTKVASFLLIFKPFELQQRPCDFSLCQPSG